MRSFLQIGATMKAPKGWRYAAVNERGQRIGETHPRAKVSDADIELIFALSAAGLNSLQIAAKFDAGVQITPRQVARILAGTQRGQAPARMKLVDTPPPNTVAAPEEFAPLGPCWSRKDSK